MSILILNNTDRYIPYKEWLSHLNEDLILITSKAITEEFENKGYKEVIGFENYSSNGCVELKALELYEQYQYSSIVATGERDLIRAGKLRDLLHLEGQSGSSALAFRDKTVMKRYAHSAGLKVPHFKLVEDTMDIISFIRGNGYPAIVKPVDGAASEGTHILKNDEDLEKLLISGVSKKSEIEEFIEGDMYHIDGLVINGQIKLIHPSKYLSGCLAFNESSALVSVMLDDNNVLFDKLVTYTTRLLEVLPTPENTAFHAEIFVTPEHELVLCEIASRNGGGKINQSYEYAFHVNLREAMVQSQCGVPVIHEIPSAQPDFYTGFILIPPKDGVITKLPMECPLSCVVDYNLNAELGGKYKHASKSTDFIASFIVKGESEDIVTSHLTKTLNWFEKSIEWRLE
ncbi:ATP-grasp domain-containing protein [Paenibacillus kribbensis]|uniref:ATP-grasp domain-containing protein n=1 Tax=Paenibacillus kribbensis TaxID=172713 RepID=UPI0015BF8ED0|nr:ATP-grasp domain-containing protein [Paenibacillus kribbensis]